MLKSNHKLIFPDSLEAPRSLGSFFFGFCNTKCSGLEVIDALTGTGKTAAVVDFIASERKDKSFKLLYAAETIQELLEVVLRLRRKMLENGTPSDDVKKYLTSSSRLSFNFNGSKNTDQKKVQDILDSDVWSKTEKNFVKSLICETNKSIDARNKLVLCTHKHLQMHSDLYEDYSVIIDEVPSFTYDLVPSKKGAAALTEAHINIVDMAGETHIDPQHVSYSICSGLVKIKDMTDSSVLYHINPNHSFKRLVIMTSYAESTELGILKKLGVDIRFHSITESKEKFSEVCQNLTIESLGNKSVTNKDSKKVESSLKIEANNPSKAFTVNTATQEVQVTSTAVRTNKRGLNSLSELNECLVATQLNLNDFDRSVYKEMFGSVGVAEIEGSLAGSKLLQSVFRGCIRKGKEMRVVCCSEEAKMRILLVLSKYR